MSSARVLGGSGRSKGSASESLLMEGGESQGSRTRGGAGAGANILGRTSTSQGPNGNGAAHPRELGQQQHQAFQAERQGQSGSGKYQNNN